MKEVVSNRQGISLIILFISGSSLVLGTAKEAKSDMWIALIIGLIAAVITVLMYYSILTHFPGKDFFAILIEVFGAIIGRIIGVLYIMYAFYLGSLVVTDFSMFIQLIGLEATPKVVVSSILTLLIIVGAKHGIEVLGRWSEFFVRFLYPIILITIPFMLSMVEVNNLKPVLSNGIQPVIQGAYSVYTFPFAETVIFIMLFDAVNIIKNPKDVRKVFVIGLLLGGLLIFITDVTAFLTIGTYAFETSYFPAYSAVSRINIGDLFERVELVIAVSYILGGFIKIGVCLLGCCRGFAKICHLKDYRFIVTPIGILLMIVSLTNFKSIMEIIEDIPNFSKVAFCYQLIIPVLLFSIIKVKCLIKKNRKIKPTH